MGNLLGYLEWRGDIPLSAMPLNVIDQLVMSRVAYLPFDGVISASFAPPRLPLGEALRRVRALGRSFRMREDEALIDMLMGSPRLNALEVGGYVNRFIRDDHNPDRQEQFSAFTAFLPDGMALVSFRGTDGTLIGWKEDFRMAFEDAIPAQTTAAEYVIALARATQGGLLLAGHSKGGNLAMYAAGFCGEDVQKRVLSATNFDGPGFNERVIEHEAIARVIDRVHTYMPQSSVVGMLLEHAERFTIVESQSVSVFQHDLYKWKIRRDAFITMEAHTQSSRYIDATLKEWLRDMRPELREKLVDGLFEIIQADGGETFRDALRGRNPLTLVRAAANLDSETRVALFEGMRRLFGAMRDALPGSASEPDDGAAFRAPRLLDGIRKFIKDL